MNIYSIYHEPRSFVGVWEADTVADALQLASEYLEIPSYDLVAVQYVPHFLRQQKGETVNEISSNGGNS